jgi:DNA-binding LacI/PurR family transcriptional regulator
MNMVWSYMDEPGLTGLILLGGILDQNFIRGLQELGLPFVIAGAHVKPLQANCVMADIIDGMQQAVNHLVATGRRQITLVNGPKTTTTSTEKYYGFRLALSLHDLPFSPEQVSTGEGDFKAESGYTQTLNILAQKPNLDAIIYADDAMAIGGLHALKENGRCVPEDVAVIGFHDYDLTRFTDPPLASVHFDMAMVGRLAARRLCTLINKPDHDPWLILVPMSLKIRKST